MIARNARLILTVDVTILLFNLGSSLIGARVLGPAGRGDLLIVVLWPPVCAKLAGLGLPTAYRYWTAKDPGRASALFSNAVIYAVLVGLAGFFVADLVVPHLIGERSPEVMTLSRIYQVNILTILFFDLMRGLLEGRRRFGWTGLARMLFFGIQTGGFATLWFFGRLTVATGAFTLITAQAAAMLLTLTAVWRELRPRWQPSWTEFKTSLGYAVRDYPGGIADFATLRLDQLMLGAMASNVVIGLYVVAVRLSEVTMLAAGAIADALMPEVAASTSERAESIWARSLRVAFYLHAIILVPLWLGAPFILKTLFGEKFMGATASFRWLLLAAVVWGLGSIVVSGLRGFNYPGLATAARFSASIVTAVALLILLPRMGIAGAAIASLIGYSVMLVIALVAFMKKRKLELWKCLRPRRRDVPSWRWIWQQAFSFARATDSPPALKTTSPGFE